VETLTEVPVIGDQVVCLGHHQAAWSDLHQRGGGRCCVACPTTSRIVVLAAPGPGIRSAPPAQKAAGSIAAARSKKDHRVRAVEAVDPGMVLDRDHFDPELIAQQVLVDAFLEQVGGEFCVVRG
jgi:hypothetical protein